MSDKKAPSLSSAAVVARTISRRLKAAGLPMADTSDRYRWTEGYHVHRLGVSRTVRVAYHVPDRNLSNEDQRHRIIAKLEEVRAKLVEFGYSVEDSKDQIHILCQSD